MKHVFSYLEINPAYLPFLFILFVVAAVVTAAHRSNREAFSIYHLVTNSNTNRGSLEKVMMLVAGLGVTWWFVDLVASGKPTWQDAVAYGGLMGLSKIANDVIGMKAAAVNLPPPKVDTEEKVQ